MVSVIGEPYIDALGIKSTHNISAIVSLGQTHVLLGVITFSGTIFVPPEADFTSVDEEMWVLIKKVDAKSVILGGRCCLKPVICYMWSGVLIVAQVEWRCS